MVALDQLCDGELMQEMASAGCVGVAVGIESPDDDNCVAVEKHHNVNRPFSEAVHRANEMGIHVCGLLMVGLPHDTPERLERTQSYLEKIPCSLYDLRIYPGSSLYDQMLSDGRIDCGWWLGKEPVETNYILPGHLRVHLKHRHFSRIQLQQWTLKLTRDLNRMNRRAFTHVLQVGRRANALGFAAKILSGRNRIVRQSRELLDQVESLITSPDRSATCNQG